MKKRAQSMSFFIDKECGTGYGPLTESLFTFYMQLLALPLKPLLCCEWVMTVRDELFLYRNLFKLP